MIFEHPLHPMFVHFTVALTCTSVLCYFLGRVLPNRKLKNELLVSSFWLILLSAGATVLTLTTGYLQFNAVIHDAGSHLAMINHRAWAIGTSIILFILAIWGARNYKKNNYSGFSYPLCLLVLFAGVSITAFKGGNLVYKYGLGVKSNPELRELKSKNEGSSHENIFSDHDIKH